MRGAVRYYSIAFSLFFGLILFFYFFGSNLFGEIVISLFCAGVIFLLINKIIQKPISKSKIRIRLQKINWIFLAGYLSLGTLRIWQTFKNPDFGDLLFGAVREAYVMGFCFIVLGVILFNRTLLIDENGVYLHDWVNTRLVYSQIKEISLFEKMIIIKTDTDEFQYKTQKLTNFEISEIDKRIEDYQKK